MSGCHNSQVGQITFAPVPQRNDIQYLYDLIKALEAKVNDLEILIVQLAKS